MESSIDAGLLEKWKVDRSIHTPLFRQLAANISFSISMSTYPPNKKLPPVKKLAKEMNLSVDTVRMAYKLLEDKGMIVSRPHHGTEIVSLLAPDIPDTGESVDGQGSFQRVIRACLKKGMTPEAISALFHDTLQQTVSIQSTSPFLFIECSTYDRDLCGQISKYLDTEIDFYLLDDLPDLRKRLESGEHNYDAAITTYFHYDAIAQMMEPFHIPLFGIVIELDNASMSHLVALPLNAKVGVLCQDIHHPLRLSSIVLGIRGDLRVRSAKRSAVNDVRDIVNWADMLIVTHPCEDDARAIRPDCPVYCFYDKVNEQSLTLLKQNVQDLRK